MKLEIKSPLVLSKMVYVVIKASVENWKDKKSGEIPIPDVSSVPYLAKDNEDAKAKMEALVTSEIENEVGKNNFPGLFTAETAQINVPKQVNYIFGQWAGEALNVYAVKETQKTVTGYIYNSVEKTYVNVLIEKWFIMPITDINEDLVHVPKNAPETDYSDMPELEEATETESPVQINCWLLQCKPEDDQIPTPPEAPAYITTPSHNNGEMLSSYDKVIDELKEVLDVRMKHISERASENGCETVDFDEIIRRFNETADQQNYFPQASSEEIEALLTKQ